MLNKISQIPPWKLKKPRILLDLTKDKKYDTDSLVLQQSFNEIRDRYSSFTSIYTDGSKDGDNVAAAAIAGRHKYCTRLSKCKRHVF